MQNSEKSTWYVARGGKAQGPRSSSEIEVGFKNGTISAQDFIFREGDKEWKKLSEVPEFSSMTSEGVNTPLPGSTPVTVSGAEWVLLIKNREDTQAGKSRYEQAGPFTRDEVLTKVRSGEAQWGDYVWKQGFSSWEKLSLIAEFNSALEFFDENDVETTATDDKAVLLAQVLTVPEAKPIQFSLDEKRPEEARGENMALSVGAGISDPTGSSNGLTQEELEKTMTVASPESFKTSKAVDSFISDETTQPGIEPDKSLPAIDVGFFTPKRVMLYGGTFVAIGIILSLSLLVSNPNKKSENVGALPAATRDVANVVEPESAVKSQPESAKPIVEEKVEQKAAVAVIPKFIKIVPLKLDTEQPQIVFENNVGTNNIIQVHVTSKDGQILDLVRFDRKIQLVRENGVVPSLNLSKWALPNGVYNVEAKSGEATASQQIFIGQKNRQFQTALDKHNKKLSLQKKSEKKEILAAVSKVEALVSQVQKKYADYKKSPTKWKEFYKGWSKELAGLNKGLLASYKPSKSDKFIYPSAINDIRSGANELFKVGRSYNEALKSKRAPAAGADLKSLKTKLKQIKNSL